MLVVGGAIGSLSFRLWISFFRYVLLFSGLLFGMKQLSGKSDLKAYSL